MDHQSLYLYIRAGSLQPIALRGARALGKGLCCEKICRRHVFPCRLPAYQIQTLMDHQSLYLYIRAGSLQPIALRGARALGKGLCCGKICRRHVFSCRLLAYQIQTLMDHQSLYLYIRAGSLQPSPFAELGLSGREAAFSILCFNQIKPLPLCTGKRLFLTI